MKIDVTELGVVKKEGTLLMYGIEGKINNQHFYASYNKGLGKITSSSIGGEDWSRLFYLWKETYKFWLHVEIVKKIKCNGLAR